MEGAEELGFDLTSLLVQVTSFLVLIVLLYFAVYRPVMRRINKRSQEAKESAKRMEKELLVKIEQGMDRYIGEVEKQRQEIVEQVKQVEEANRQKAQGENEEALEAIINKARTEIGHQRDIAIGEIRREFNDLTKPEEEKKVD